MEEDKGRRRDLLSSVMKVPTETISIDKKYHRRINLKYSLLTQAKSIEDDKESYLKWYDSSRNSSTNSPIYTRVPPFPRRSTSSFRNYQGRSRPS